MRYGVLFLFGLLLVMCSRSNEPERKAKMEQLNKRINKFVETKLTYDHNLLNERQKKVVEKLYKASKIVDEIYLDQVYSRNKEIRAQLQSSDDPMDKLTLEYFNIMFGPFDRLDHNKPFYGTQEKPLGANFYPEDMTKQEFEQWIKDHPEDEKAFTSEFTVIRRQDGKLVAIPYSEYYKGQLTLMSNLLKEAAQYADNPSLKRYLLARAKAFLTNDYFESDMAWMDLKDNLIEVVIGPYEVYEDELFNYKASFESFLTLKDPEASKKLEMFASYLDDIERNLPNPESQKNFNRGSESPIVVVQEIFSAGDTKAGVQTLAFNLPNDERVREAKGSKKVMLKNMHEAKFENLLKPIAKRVIVPDQLEYVTFDGFFNHTLMHEISHGVGPGTLVINGRKTDVKKELKETYSKIEECKADVLGMYNNIFMIKKGVYPESFAKETWVTFLAGIFRSIRFGINEAHGAGNSIIYNYLLEKGAYEYDPSIKAVRVKFDKIYDAVKDLAHELLIIQGTGDYQGAKKLIEKYAVESPSMHDMRIKLTDLPVDIRPVFQIEEELGK